jgi:putative acetyltransferase
MKIRVDDLTGAPIQQLLQQHLQGMAEQSPPESVHALGLEALRQPGITVWTGWEGDELLGCGALKQLDPRHGEIKSMRTASAHLRQGVAKALLAHLIEAATQRGYTRLSLETGSTAAFEPALRLYASFGFQRCEPFADYRLDPFSIFMMRSLDASDVRPPG